MGRFLQSVIVVVLFALTAAPASTFGQTPHIATVYPAQNASNVSMGTNITVIFDTPMAGGTINNNSFKVSSPFNGVVQGTVTYNNQLLTARFDPLNNFKPGEVVTVVLTTDITSSSGQPLARGYSWRFTVIVGSGGGSFELHATYDLSFGDNYAICAADFNQDGHIDLAVTSYEWNSQTVGILLNDGAGGFSTPALYDGGQAIHGVSAADFNGDGFPDLVTGNSYFQTVTILMNNGPGYNGAFGNPTAYPIDGDGSGTAVGDFDNDGDIDVAAVGLDKVSILVNNGDGTFATPCVSYVVGQWLNNLVAADFNGDGFLDLATGDWSDDLQVLLNAGDGSFGAPQPYPIGDNSNIYGITTADLDNDRDLDIVATGDLILHMSIMTNDGSGHFQLHSLYNPGGHCHFPMVGDIDADGDQDIFFEVNHNVLYTYFNYGDATFEKCGTYDSGTDPNGVAVADYDGDGDLDAAIVDGSSITGRKLRIFYNVEPHPCPPLRKDKECGIIWIDKVEEVLLGHYAKISIFGENFRFEMGAFDFLIAYDAPALTFIEAQPGQMLDSCNWEYFTYRFGADGNCGDACPSGLLRIIALAETNNGPIHPTCFGPPDTDPHELADLTFYVTPDRTIQGQYLPVWFFWGDCGDNTISNVGGDTLYLDRCVRDFQDNVIWNELDDENYPETGRIRFVGAPDACILDTALRPDLKTVPTRCICFRFGGFDIIPDTLIDARGDINLNGIPNEVADAVMLTNYFIEGPTAFDNHYEGSVAASDVNADGIALSIGDLVYLIRIITGDALPYAKPVASAEPAQLSLLVNHTAASLAVNSAADLGAGYFVINHTGYTVSPPQLINGASDMTLKYSDENGILKVLVYSMEKDHKIAAGSQHLLVIPISGQGTLTIQDAQLADYFGRLIPVETAGPAPMPSAYALHQNYPNPFNATTRIIYELPQPAQVKLEIINVLGQTVATVIDRYESAGIHSAEWSGTDGQGHPVASGIYLYRMTAGGFTAEKKMVLMK